MHTRCSIYTVKFNGESEVCKDRVLEFRPWGLLLWADLWAPSS